MILQKCVQEHCNRISKVTIRNKLKSIKLEYSKTFIEVRTQDNTFYLQMTEKGEDGEDLWHDFPRGSIFARLYFNASAFFLYPCVLL